MRTPCIARAVVCVATLIGCGNDDTSGNASGQPATPQSAVDGAGSGGTKNADGSAPAAADGSVPADGSKDVSQNETATLPEAGPDAADPCNDVLHYGPELWPPACWRPYASTSPFNRLVAANPKLDTRSSATVSAVFTSSTWFNISGGAPPSSYDDCDLPLYWLAPGVKTSEYTILCMRTSGPTQQYCDLHNKTIAIPDAAVPKGCGGKGDGQMTIVDAKAGLVYDLYRAFDRPAGGGVWDITHNGTFEAWAGTTQLSGAGLGGGCTAANTGLAAGMLRTEELLEGRIDHALAMVVSCIGEVSSVYPAKGGALPCDIVNHPELKVMPATGARFWLEASDAELDALPLAPIQRLIFGALSHYGAYITDTVGGTQGSTGILFQVESAADHIVFDQPNPWDMTDAGSQKSMIAVYGSQALMIRGPQVNPAFHDQFYTYNLAFDGDGSGTFSPMDYMRQHMRVLDPCTAERDCTN